MRIFRLHSLREAFSRVVFRVELCEAIIQDMLIALKSLFFRQCALDVWTVQ